MNDERLNTLLDKAYERNTDKGILNTDAREFMIERSSGARVKGSFSGLWAAGIAAAALALVVGGLYIKGLKHLENTPELVAGSTTVINEYTPKHLYDENADDFAAKPYCFDFERAVNNITVGGVKLEMPLTVESLSKDFDIYSDNELGSTRLIGFKAKGDSELAFSIEVKNDKDYKTAHAQTFYVNDEHKITERNVVSIEGLELGMDELDILYLWGADRVDNLIGETDRYLISDTSTYYAGANGGGIFIDHNVSYTYYDPEGIDNDLVKYRRSNGQIHAFRIDF